MTSQHPTQPPEPPRPEAPIPPAWPPPPPPPPRAEKTSGYAIAAFVFGLLGAVVLGVIFGIVALRRIRSRGEQGRGFAIAGIALSGAWTVVIVLVVVLVISIGSERDSSGRVTESGSESVFDLRVGDCLNDLEETSEELSVDVAPCAKPHDAQVVSSFDVDAGDWPGLAAVTSQADASCTRSVEAVAPSAEVFYFHPTEGSWELDDREVLCVALFPRPRRGEL